MKTIKFIFSLLVSVMLVVPSWAAGDSYDEYVYAKDFTIMSGETAYLPIAVKNTNAEISGIQFTVTLPDGLSFIIDENPDQLESEEEETAGISVYYKVYKECTISNWIVQAFTGKNAPSNTAKLLLFSMNKASISKGDRIILYIPLNVSSDIDVSNAKVMLSEETMNTSDDKEITPLAIGETLSANLSKATFSSDYSIEITPFSLKKTDNDYEVILNMSCNQEDINDIRLDINMPSILTVTEDRSGPLAPVTADGKRLGQKDHSISMIDNHVSILSITEGDYRMIAKKSGPLVKFFYTSASILKSSIPTLTLEHIHLKKDDGSYIYLPPYTADIYVGVTNPVATPDENGAVAFHGNYADESTQTLMTEALMSNDITTINLSEVTAATKIEPQNPNAIIRCTKDLGLDQPNVVIGDVCANLVLTDGHAFRNTEEFTANTASYSRTMTNHSWGTLCLPFAATSTNANVYTLNSVTTGADGEMKFTQAAAAAVEANTPCVIKKDAEDVTFAASNVMVGATPAESKAGTGAPDWTLNGTTIDLNFTTDLSSLYFINGDQFWQASNSLHVAPFRAYFNGPAGSLQAKFRITEETNGIETIENEAEAGVIYDLQGRAVEAAQAGQIYVQGAKKFVVK